jgi:hypothetical protein
MAMRRSVVATGLRIKGSEIFIGKEIQMAKSKWQNSNVAPRTAPATSLLPLLPLLPFAISNPFAICSLPFAI